LLSECCKQIVPRASAILPGAVNQEVLCFSKDHKELVRFANIQDEDFQSVVSHLRVMIDACQAAIDRNWVVIGKERANVAEPSKSKLIDEVSTVLTFSSEKCAVIKI
jgi:hypothetical protein